MARNSEDKSGKPTTTTRLYSETVQILRILAEAQGLPMIEYAHKLALKAVSTDSPALAHQLNRWQAEAKK